LAQRRLLARFEAVFHHQSVPVRRQRGRLRADCATRTIHPEEVLWDLRQPQRLLLIYLLLALPFFFAANAVALALTHYRRRIPQVYAADLLGAGIGSLSIIALLTLCFPLQALGTLGACALLAATVAMWELGVARRPLWTLAALIRRCRAVDTCR